MIKRFFIFLFFAIVYSIQRGWKEKELAYYYTKFVVKDEMLLKITFIGKVYYV